MTGSLLGPKAVAELRKVVRQVLFENSRLPRGGHLGAVREARRDHVVLRVSTDGVTGRNVNTPGTGTATLYYKTTGGTLTQWSTNSVTVNNLSTQSVGGDEYVTATQDSFGAYYTPVTVTTSSESRVYATADAVLLPGSTAGTNFSIQSYTTSGWAATTDTITVRDPGKLACYLVGEAGYFVSPNQTDYFPNSEHGLRRLMETTSSIAVDASGSAKFVINGTATTANGTVTVNNDFPGKYNRRVHAGENNLFWCSYERTSSKWQIEPAPMSQFSVGDATTHMDPFDTGGAKTSFGSWRTQDWLVNGSTSTSTLAAGSWTNSYDMAARSGAQTLLWRSLDNAVGSWVPIQADQVSIVPHTDLRVSTASGQVQVKTREFYGHTHVAVSSWTNKIATTSCT